MNISWKYILICILLILFLLYFIKISKNKITDKNIKNKSKNNIYGGNTLTNCTLNDISRHNAISDKWVYLNGIIYNFSSYKEIIYPDALINIDIYISDSDKKNFTTLINIIRYTDLQDLYTIFKSIEAYNKFIRNNRTDIESKYNTDKNLLKSNGDFILIEFENRNDDNNIEDRFIDFTDGFHNFFTNNKIGVMCPLRLNI